MILVSLKRKITKTLTQFILILMISEASAQDGYGKNDSIRSVRIWYNSRITVIDFGVMQFNNTIGSIGASFYRQNIYSYFNHRINFNFNFKGAIGGNYQFDIGMYGVNVGINSQYYSYKENNYIYIAPVIGINLVKFKIFYNYNIQASKIAQSPAILNKNAISFSFGIIAKDKSNIEKYKYKLKYRNAIKNSLNDY
jgi:hypothetical protein